MTAPRGSGQARPTHAQLIARGRAAEWADMLALIDEMIVGVPALKAKYLAHGAGGDVDFDLYGERLRALRGTIESGLHVSFAAPRLPESLR